jgi:hypothetical protein
LPIPTHASPAIVERTTAEFRRDWERLSPADQKRVRDALNRGYGMLRENRPGIFSRVQRPLQIQLKGGLASSLSSLRVGREISLVLAVDDDPVFGQTLVTLFRVVQHEELERAYRSIAQRLYRNKIESRNGAT